MDERKTRFNKALQGSFDDVDVFTNINEIKKLGKEIQLLDVINPTSSTYKKLAGEIKIIDVINPSSAIYGKLAELLARIKSLRDFELITGGEELFKNRQN